MAYSTEYERLAPAVTSIGWLVSATAVIIFSFKGRANWEPSKQDLTPGPQRIAGFLTAIGIGVIWKRLGYSAYNDLLTNLAVDLALACLVFLIVYTVLIFTKTFTQAYFPVANEVASRNEVPSRKILGGFCLTDAAKGSLSRQRGLTTQDLLTAGGNDPDKVWKPSSRAWAKACFILGYVGLTICGSVTLASAAILLLPRERMRVVEESSGPQLSGMGDAWSSWYSVDLGPAPSGYTLNKAEFWLTGDRKCNLGAECKVASENDSGVTGIFRLKGRARSTSALRSEGHLKVTYEPLPLTPSEKPTFGPPEAVQGPE